MRKNLLAKIADYLARNRRYRIWAKVVGALACVVVFITTYMLILPAITLEKTPFCGLEEHTHTQECYRKVEAQTVSVLDCSLESLDIHTHTADCYDDEGELQCGYADFVVHTHDSSCYDAKGNQVCQLPEIKEHLHTENCYVPTAEGHTHTDACYTIQNGDLVCQLSEGEDHQHSDACYEQEKILICGLEETEASEPQLICDKPEVELHTHTSTCYDENDNLVCDKLEVLEHVHGEECFELLAVSDDELTCGLGEDEKHTHTDLCYGQWELVCELTEHTHTESCYEVETEADEDAAASAVEAEAEAGGIMPLSDELPVEVVAGGDIEGTELTWTFTKNLAGEYTLTISGEGAIPDYSAYGAPWNDYISKTAQNLRTSLVIEEGITGIGQYAFIGGNFVDASLPDTLTSIGYGAFQGCAFTSINIPGSVKTLARQSFAYCSALRSITLNEGLESLDGIAFWYSGLQELHLPASLTTITDGLRNIAGTITVAEGNECFKVVDGVLFQLNEDKTAWKLTAYPTNLPGESYTVPAEIDGKPVKEIASCAFYQVTQLLNITIPESVTAISSSAFQVSSLQTAVLECTTLQSNPGGFIDATNLREIDISHLTGAIPREFFKNSHLSSITIPEGITSIGLSAFQGCSYLNEVVYDAQNATCGITVMGISDLPRYDLTIGTHVDVLNQSFSQIAGRADSLRFEGPNQITIAEGALAGAPEPFSTLSGDIYVDKNGLIYIYDKETRTASLFYCPPGVETATVPAAITPEDGATCTVTAVTMNALKYAVNLESITFETPESIVSLDAYALANCPTLTSANGKTNVKDALVSFPKAERGYNVFYNTGLDGASGDGSFETDMDGRKSLSVSKTGAPELDIIVNSDGGTMEWIFDDEGSDVGGYRLLTGDTLTVTASVGNTEGDSDDIYRIYLRLTNEDGSLSVEPGQSYTFNGQTVTCHATEDPYTVYLEFQAPIGVTLSFPVTAVYPSPDSPGGGLTVWGCILTPEEAEANENLLMESQSDSIQAYWTTEPDNFVLAKTGTGISALSVIGDGAGGAMPNANLNWQIKLNREMETTSAYGKDYAESADFTDVLTLPEGVSWKESVIEAIQSGNVWWNGNYLYADDVMVASLSLSGSGLYLTGRQVEWDAEKNTAVFHWRVLSGTEMAEMNASTVSFIICDDALSVDMAIFAPTEKSTITNTANAIVHYNYSEDKELTSNATKTITGGTGNIKLTKTATDVHYFGEDITYTLDVYNNGGLPWTGVDGVYTLSDPLSQYVYISPENLQRMFMEEY